MSHHAPPPTKFGLPGTAQAKLVGMATRPVHAPPPTKFGGPVARPALQEKARTFPPLSPVTVHSCGCGCQPPSPRLRQGLPVQRMRSLIENTSSNVTKVGSNLTFKEVTGGNVQTTSLRAKLNGEFIGKFNNVTRSMASNDLKEAQGVLIKLKSLGYSIGDKVKPHAEDYLIKYFHDNAESKTFSGGDLLSIAMDKSPCIVCAQNLVSFAGKFGFRLRIKAGVHFEATKKRGAPKGISGTEFLEEKGVPIRAWPLANIAEKLKANLDDVSSKMEPRYKISFGKFALSNSAIGLFDTFKTKKIGWKTVGYSRSQAADPISGKNWK